MQKVRSVGGIFFRCKGDLKARMALLDWYKTHLGIDYDSEWGGTVFEDGKSLSEGLTWSIFKSDTTYFGEGNDFMVNYKVDDLDAMLAQLREGGVKVEEHVERSEYGNFGWCYDPEGNKIELWQGPTDT